MTKLKALTLRVGLLLFILLNIMDRFIMPVADWLAILILIIAVELV